MANGIANVGVLAEKPKPQASNTVHTTLRRPTLVDSDVENATNAWNGEASRR